MFHLDHIEGLGVAAAEVVGLLEEVAVMYARKSVAAECLMEEAVDQTRREALASIDSATAAITADGRVALRARVLLDMYGLGGGGGSPARVADGRQAVPHLGAGTEGLIAEAYQSLLQEPEELADDRCFLESVQRCVELMRLSQDGGAGGWSDEAEDAYSPFKK